MGTCVCREFPLPVNVIVINNDKLRNMAMNYLHGHNVGQEVMQHLFYICIILLHGRHDYPYCWIRG